MVAGRELTGYVVPISSGVNLCYNNNKLLKTIFIARYFNFQVNKDAEALPSLALVK